MDSRLAEAFFNRANHRVLGVRLRPFCLWHAFVLEVLEHPLAVGGEAAGPVSFTDLATAVAICSRGFEAPVFRRRSPFRLFRRFRPFHTETEKFRAYLRDYATEAVPLFMQSDRSRPVQTPWALFRVCQLMRYGYEGGSARAAWLCPYGQAIWYATGLGEANGAETGLVSEEMAAALKEAGYPEFGGTPPLDDADGDEIHPDDIFMAEPAPDSER